MIQRQNRPTDRRRILTSPAVHPCENISQATLLASLIHLAATICQRGKQFVTQRKNARRAIRKVGILLMFLEEIRDCELVFSDSVFLCFSELHLAFQKILFLLEDLGREDATLWVLMKSEFVAGQFRMLIGSIATAIEILPLDSMNICGEVKEYVELVVKHGRNGEMEVDPDEELVGKQVESVLNCFDRGIEPDFDFVKRILDFVGIRTWSHCNGQIEFLEEQIELRSSGGEGEQREVSFLSSWLGVLSYCRGVIFFQTLDSNAGEEEQSETGIISEKLGCLNPEDFRCPISLELMTDPVTVSTGQTYDRSSIQKWLKSGNTTCPKTGERLQSKELVPNTSLRNVIHQFCIDRGISLPTAATQGGSNIAGTINPGSNSAAAAMRFLSRFLARRLVFGTEEEKNKAAYEVRLLSKSNIFNRGCLIQAGVILPLLNLLNSSASQENAIAALLKLSKHAGGKRAIVENDGIRSILAVLKNGSSSESKQIAAATIFYLSSVKGYRKLIGETPEAIPGLIELIRSGTHCGKKNAVVALFGLLMYQGNSQRVLRNGAVPVLIDVVLGSDKEELVADSLAVLASLAETVEGTIELVRNSGLAVAIKGLQSMRSVRGGKEHCISMLWSLCKNGGAEVVEALAGEQSVMGSLYSAATEGSSASGRGKARDLIKVLQRFCETGALGDFLDSDGPCERPQLREL
ncbi:unnamed protein product [Linum tenue]|uniref:RING-type E3 ubiquitin transferase n=2 Tax=Linum tenue TaxID=586396 RepID=A0AAV0IML1_9ROSI|nr:unnamed protein product [Linum tenue]